ncbi:MAG: exodeoxyribonuclease III [Alphaproteobacteria bacterium]|nr:exodeoxyribonuclease III [Alphaproteobacteria bacterium]
MRILSWNINSVRLRLPLLMDVLKRQKPDVFCLQETKTPDEHFPVDALVEAGYAHHHFTGMKGYNGVCIFSKYPIDNKETYKRCGKNDCRHISARIKGKNLSFELHNVYIPAGGYEPDPVANDKFKHKLDFVDELTKWFSKNRGAKDPMVVLGDLNIAPLEHDVWDHKKMVKVVSHTPIEVEKFTRFYESMQWVDGIRHFVPDDKKLYSWWSYRSPDWDAADKGRRLDHIWVTQRLAPALKKQAVLREMRGAERPSDHVPVVLDLKASA